MSDALLDAPVATEQDDRDEWLMAWAAVLLLLGANAAKNLTARQRRRARDLLRVRFEAAALRNAQRATAGQVGADAWQAAVADDIAGYTRQMAVAGAGTLPVATVQEQARQEIARQLPYLAGFAAALAGMSAAAIAARTRQYGGGGWGMFHVAQGSTAGENVVEKWVSRDDNRTCPICSARNGQYFLPGVGPMPASDCYGGGHCRCERIQVVNREVYARLSGRR